LLVDGPNDEDIIQSEENIKNHVVQANETLYSIARSYGKKINDLVKWNNINPKSYQLSIGQVLIVSKDDSVQVTNSIDNSLEIKTNISEDITKIHVVQANETLYYIARKYGQKISNLTRWNDINLKSYQLYVGQTLIVSKDDSRITLPIPFEEALDLSKKTLEALEKAVLFETEANYQQAAKMYLQLATQSSSSTKQGYHISAIRNFLKANMIEEAKIVLDKLDSKYGAGLEIPLALINVQIDLARQRFKSALETLRRIEPDSLFPTLKLEYEQLYAQALAGENKTNITKIHALSVGQILKVSEGEYVKPSTFIENNNEAENWKIIYLHDNYGMFTDKNKEVWRRIIDTLSKTYKLEVLDKASGYISTSWKYISLTLNNNDKQKYRSRVTIKMLGNVWHMVKFKIESQLSFVNDTWLTGYDIAVLEKTYKDLQDSVGRLEEGNDINSKSHLLNSIENARISQKLAKKLFKSCLEKYSLVVNFDGNTLKQKYDQLSLEFERSNLKAREIKKYIGSMDDVSDTLFFREWKTETKEQYIKLIEAMKLVKRKIEPTFTIFRDQILFLKHNLNTRAISVVQNELISVESGMASLIKKMDISILEADTFIKLMTKE